MLKFCKKCNTDTERTKNGRCKACHNSNALKYRKNNPEKVKETNLKYKSANSEQIKIARSEYYSKNKEKLKLGRKKWEEKNPHAGQIRKQNRWARKRAVGGRLSNGLKDKLYKLQRGKCACCNLPLGANYHMDHIMPIVLGGTNTDNNIQLLRQKCNNQKHTKHPVDFMQSRGFLI